MSMCTLTFWLLPTSATYGLELGSTISQCDSTSVGTTCNERAEGFAPKCKIRRLCCTLQLAVGSICSLPTFLSCDPLLVSGSLSSPTPSNKASSASSADCTPCAVQQTLLYHHTFQGMGSISPYTLPYRTTTCATSYLAHNNSSSLFDREAQLCIFRQSYVSL